MIYTYILRYILILIIQTFTIYSSLLRAVILVFNFHQLHVELWQDLYATVKRVSGSEVGTMYERLIKIYTQPQ